MYNFPLCHIVDLASNTLSHYYSIVLYGPNLQSNAVLEETVRLD